MSAGTLFGSSSVTMGCAAGLVVVIRVASLAGRRFREAKRRTMGVGAVTGSARRPPISAEGEPGIAEREAGVAESERGPFVALALALALALRPSPFALRPSPFALRPSSFALALRPRPRPPPRPFFFLSRAEACCVCASRQEPRTRGRRPSLGRVPVVEATEIRYLLEARLEKHALGARGALTGAAIDHDGLVLVSARQSLDVGGSAE
jgi:hypothetical protein